MQITEIKKDKLHLMKITFDNDSVVFLDKTVCADKCLNVGMYLEQEQLKELEFLSDYTRAKSRAVWYLDRQDHTEKALYDKLIRAGFGKQASAKVIARFIEVGLIDDERYARNYAERLMEANVSKREAVQKMLLKGVPYDLAKAVLEETEADEQTQIKNLIDKKYRTKLTDQKGVEKVFAALARKGFSYSAVKEALKSYIEESEDEYV
ncbi:MAG: regulatory protein RecX [Ruminococcaceae bacterium]|nr:regulatory protein RecX [Oscillospiraceae bacterium]